jgi:hypothetical protein
MEEAKQAWLDRRAQKRDSKTRSNKATYASWLRKKHGMSPLEDNAGSCARASPVDSQVFATFPANSKESGTEHSASDSCSDMPSDWSYISKSDIGGPATKSMLKRKVQGARVFSNMKKKVTYSSDSDSAAQAQTNPTGKAGFSDEDNSVSAEVMRRAMMLEEAAAGKDLVVWGLDGSGRQTDEQATLLREQCQALNARYEEGIDITESSLPTITQSSLPTLTEGSLPALTRDSLPAMDTRNSLPRMSDTMDSLPKHHITTDTLPELDSEGYSSSAQEGPSTSEAAGCGWTPAASQWRTSCNSGGEDSDHEQDLQRARLLPVILEEARAMSMDSLPSMSGAKEPSDTSGTEKARTLDSLPDLDLSGEDSDGPCTRQAGLARRRARKKASRSSRSSGRAYTSYESLSLDIESVRGREPSCASHDAASDRKGSRSKGSDDNSSASPSSRCTRNTASSMEAEKDFESAMEAWLARKERKRANKSTKPTYGTWLREKHEKTIREATPVTGL